MMLAFLALAACVREHAASVRRVLYHWPVLRGRLLAVIALDYFIQLRTVQRRFARQSSYFSHTAPRRPHRAQELGFLVMGLSFAFFAFALGSSRLDGHALGVSGLLGADGRGFRGDVVDHVSALSIGSRSRPSPSPGSP